jgi:hypothetical protein
VAALIFLKVKKPVRRSNPFNAVKIAHEFKMFD